MLRYVVKRLASAFALLVAVPTVAFLLVESAPGKASDVLLGDRPVPPEVRQRIEQAYGLDRPAGERYVHWLCSLLLHGELGWSASRSRPVARVLGDAVPATLPLAGAALLIHVTVGVGLGLVSASFRGRRLDRALDVASLVVYSMPVFWVGLMAILLFAYVLPVFPAASMRSVGSGDWSWPRRAADVLWHVTLPAAVLGLASAAALGRFVRSGVIDALRESFVRAARARGAGPGRALVAHAFRNALLPAITLVGLSLPVLVSGSLVIEVVFAWPGMGRLAYEAILARDVPVVLASTLAATLLVVVGNLLADLALAAADPRIRLGRSGGEP